MGIIVHLPCRTVLSLGFVSYVDGELLLMESLVLEFAKLDASLTRVLVLVPW